MSDGSDILGALLLSALAVGATLLVTRGLDRLLGVSHRSSPRRRTPFLDSARHYLPLIRATAWLATGFAVLGILLDRTSQLTALVATLPLLLGSGLALRERFGDAIAGIMLAIDRPFESGDRIEIGDTHGAILGLGLTQTRILTDDGREVRLPNARLLSEGFQTAQLGHGEVPIDVHLPIPEGMKLSDACAEAYQTAILSRYASPRQRPEVFVETRGETVSLRIRAFACDPSLFEAYESDLIEIWFEEVIAAG
jgi:small-conductance mechanosensitive channel